VALAARPNHTHASTVCLYCIGINKKEWVAARERSSSGRRPAGGKLRQIRSGLTQVACLVPISQHDVV
jgi:hypothetical protein